MTKKKSDSLPRRAGLSTISGQALGGFALLLLVGVQMRIFATVFDHDLALLAIGVALFGMAGGLALGHWLAPREAGEEGGHRAAAGLLIAGLTASGGLVLLLSWPLGAVITFLVTVAAFSAPFAAWGYGIAHVSRSPGARAILGAWSGGALAGLLLAGMLVESVGDPLRVGWWASAVLGAAALVSVGRRISAGLGAGIVMIFASAAYFLAGGYALTPTWSEAGFASARPLYAELRSDKLAAAPVTAWSGTHRTDVLTYQGQEPDLRWLFTDATAPVPVLIGGDQNIDWLKRRFPLLAIPMLASKPQRLLTIGAFAGPELALARAVGVSELQALAYNGDALEVLRREGRQPGLEAVGSALRYSVDPRAAVRADRAGVDQIILPITHINKQGWVGANYQDRNLYTLEAFQDYWQRLRPGGLLVVTTADETLFVRTVLSVWAMLERQPAAATGGPSAQRSWGLRLAPGAPFQGPYQYLFIVAKGNVAAQLPARLQQAYQGLPIEPLFGPGLGAGQRDAGNLFGRSQQPAQSSPVESLLGAGFLATRYYAALYQLGGLAKAEEILTRALSQQAGRWVSVSPATDHRPVFFDVLAEQRPELKWLLTGTLLILVGSVLFALPSMRRPEAVTTQTQPAVAVFLTYFALIGVAGAVMFVGVLGQPARLVGVSLATQAVLLAVVLAGAVAALLLIRGPGFSRLSIVLPPLAALILSALLYGMIGPGSTAIAAWPDPARWLLVTGCSVLAGVALASLCGGTLRHLAAFAPAVVAWAWLVLGAAALGGVVLAEWWGAVWGWGLVWPALCGAYGVIVVAGFWLWRWPGRQDRPPSTEAAAEA